MTMWVFGYGSLVWNPGFEVSEKVIATLPGYHRSFCMRSIHHRGTSEDPGLVLALDEDEHATCQGVALAVPEGAEDTTLEYLREELHDQRGFAYQCTGIACESVGVVQEAGSAACGDGSSQDVSFAVSLRGSSIGSLHHVA